MSDSNFRKKAGELYTYAEQYVEAKVELTKLQISEKIAKISSIFISMLIIALFIVLTFLFFLVTLTIWLGELLDSYLLAFGYVTLGLFVISLIAVFLRKKILEAPLINGIIKKLYDEE